MYHFLLSRFLGGAATPKHDSFLEGKEGTTCDTLPQKGTVCPFVKSGRLVNPQKGTN